jgi:hypothetical protein
MSHIQCVDKKGDSMKINFILFILAVSIPCASFPMQKKSSASKCCGLFASCCGGFEKVIEYGENIIQVLEAAHPNLMEKAVFDAIIKVMDLSKPALIALVNACKAEEAKLDAASAVTLKSLGLVHASGQISQQVKDVVNSTITITPKDK